MALPLPIAPSSAPADGHSPISDESSVPPQTPMSPTDAQTLALPGALEAQNTTQPQSPTNAAPTSGPTTQVKRKPSRRANTAERRANHNAVERQRRETLNGRFLDLAALLPNLSQIRRPSKSAIVNSSIAHIHASRRHRLLASRELRTLKLESDALRRELNEWRDRAGLPRVEEPVRGEGFGMVLSGEVEILAAAVGEEDEEGQGQYDGYEDGEDDFTGSLPTIMDESEDGVPANATAMFKNTDMFGQHMAGGNAPHADVHVAHLMPRGPTGAHGGPMIAQMPASVSFENPVMPSLYEPQVAPHFSGTTFMGHHAIAPETEKVAAWTANMYAAYHSQQLQHHVQRPMITPPNSALSHSTSSPASAGGYSDQVLLANLKRQQMLALQHQHGAMAYAADGDDASSVGSSPSGRERSGSLSTGSGYGSPPQVASPGSYDLSSAQPEFGKRMNAGLHINTGVASGAGSWPGRGEEGMSGMGMKQALGTPMSVGSGHGGGYGVMMGGI
ncbi:hypothetical protein F5I97DRAFT_1934138 [Phlebopus sp. FC_14]|nr:hypothetical protein F5I97DRAFT_1934138 [Phlebopus sp. FC_14]